MVLGNIMVLCEIDPDEVYRWFMELFIDAYDWVMVPNVYGMSQHADGGLITTKPYISSSNYLRKMSDFGEGPWCAIWDGLYWRFVLQTQGVLHKESQDEGHGQPSRPNGEEKDKGTSDGCREISGGIIIGDRLVFHAKWAISRHRCS